MNVAEVMRREVEFVPAEATVQQAAQVMCELGVGALPVGARDDLQGIVTARDILVRVVASGRDSGEVSVGKIMSRMVFSCREEDSLEDALAAMTAHDIRRMPVLGPTGQVTGWVTLQHIALRLLAEGRLVAGMLANATELPQ